MCNLQANNKMNFNIKTKIFTENGAPYVILETNLCKRPLKFLVDTGAAISLIANDIISEKTYKIDYEVTVFGIIGKDVTVRTQGMITGILNIENQLMGTLFHIVDRKYLGSVDGYLGYDFLSPYGAILDMKEMFLKLNNIEFSTKEKPKLEVKNELNNDKKLKMMNDKDEIEYNEYMNE